MSDTYHYSGAHLEISTADEQVHLPPLNLLKVLQGAIDVVQLTMAAPFNGNL